MILYAWKSGKNDFLIHDEIILASHQTRNSPIQWLTTKMQIVASHEFHNSQIQWLSSIMDIVGSHQFQNSQILWLTTFCAWRSHIYPKIHFVSKTCCKNTQVFISVIYDKDTHRGNNENKYVP